MLEQTEFGHFTVPHCGTRYINKAVVNAIGEKEYQVPSKKMYERSKRHQKNQRFIFCHIGPKWEEWITQLCRADHIKTWTTVREPIMTWSTHWGHIEKNLETPLHVYQKLGQMRCQWESLMRMKDEFQYIHRVEDPLDGLSEFLGLELEPHEQKFSRPTQIKQALWERDTDKIASLCEGTEFWKAFHDYITPDIAEFYEDLGYDIWWYNG